nr:synaptotagmin-16 isoform X2 [Parasteatoda tepidariorum]
MIEVPTEASAFLLAVVFCLILLVLFYLYMTKNACFATIGGFPCCDKPLGDNQPATKDLESVEGIKVLATQVKDQIFDVNDLQCNIEEQETSSAVRCGSLEVGFAYDSPLKKMTVHVLQAQDLPDRERGGSNHVQVRLLLLPHKRQKFKTKIRTGCKPQFNESFIFNRISPEELNGMGVRFRLNGCERMRREHLIGECIVHFSSIRMDQQTTLWLTLEPRSNITHSDSRADITSLARSDSTGSTQSMQHGGLPELLLGLAYNGTTGRLSIEVNKGSHFRNVSMNRAPDTYVKLCLVSSNGQELARSKTSVRRGQPNPLFKETFIFQVALFQLPDVTLMISVYNKRSMKRKEMIGWFSLGLNSSGDEELAHWNDMRENRGEQVCRWHVLLET